MQNFTKKPKPNDTEEQASEEELGLWFDDNEESGINTNQGDVFFWNDQAEKKVNYSGIQILEVCNTNKQQENEQENEIRLKASKKILSNTI